MKYQKKHKSARLFFSTEVMRYILFMVAMVTWIKVVEGTNNEVVDPLIKSAEITVPLQLQHQENVPQKSEAGIMFFVASLTFALNVITTQLNYAAFMIAGLEGEGETGIYGEHLFSEAGPLVPWPFHFISDTFAGLWPLSTILLFCAVWNFYFSFFLMLNPTEYGLFRNIKLHWRQLRFWKATGVDAQKLFSSFAILGMLVLAVFPDAPYSIPAHYLVAIHSTAAAVSHQIHQIAAIVMFFSMVMITRIQVVFLNPSTRAGLTLRKWVANRGQWVAYKCMQKPAGVLVFIRLLIWLLHYWKLPVNPSVFWVDQYYFTPLAEWVLGMGLSTFTVGLAVQLIESIGPSLKRIFTNHKGKAMITLVVNFIWLVLQIFINVWFSYV